LPPFGLADGIAGLSTAFAILVALQHRERTGRGQQIDQAIIDPILTVVGPAPTVYDQLGVIQTRNGNRSTNNAPRNTYRTGDGKWVAISTSAQSIAERVMRLVGHEGVVEQPWFGSGKGRAEHADELDAAVSSWIAARSTTEVLDQFTAAEAAIAPIYDASDILADPQLQARQSIVTVADEELGPLQMQNVLFRMSESAGAIRWAGRRKGADTETILDEVGIDRAAQLRLQEAGVT
jgi:crotonobetainyl-CoA:carnitine CoA-transferase CaiB-like acyl-CoA transferase